MDSPGVSTDNAGNEDVVVDVTTCLWEGALATTDAGTYTSCPVAGFSNATNSSPLHGEDDDDDDDEIDEDVEEEEEKEEVEDSVVVRALEDCDCDEVTETTRLLVVPSLETSVCFALPDSCAVFSSFSSADSTTIGAAFPAEASEAMVFLSCDTAVS